MGSNAVIMEVEEALPMWDTPPVKALFLSVVALLALGSSWGVQGQGLATFRVEENIRAEANGVVLGRVLPGVALPVLSRDDRWVQLQLEGWIWTRSIQATDRLGFDLVVSVAPRENLRAEPSGEVLATLVEGTLLDRWEDVPGGRGLGGWVGCGRSRWIWTRPRPLRSQSNLWRLPNPQVKSGGGRGVPAGHRSSPALTVIRWPWPALGRNFGYWPGRGTGSGSGWRGGVGPRRGWGGIPRRGVGGGTHTDGSGPEPSASSGEDCDLELQFVSLERAEMIRTDFYEGEPFLLTRTGSSESIFVYVAVPPDRLDEVEGLIPLERIRVVGRLRTGAAALTGNPILDLLELTRLSRN